MNKIFPVLHNFSTEYGVMAFCSFSKDCDNHSYITIESKFITKFLPKADGFTVKVYLYGLYLCQNFPLDFNIKSMAEVLKATEPEIKKAFHFWEEYDLVNVVSQEPFAVQYLPIQSAVGKPKKVRYEQYADFNQELQRKMQKVGKYISANDYLKYMKFLEESSMQPQAFLLIAEYCINKQGQDIVPSYIFNKANKLIRSGAFTYEQVERELSSFNANEKDLTALLKIFGGVNARTPDETDYSMYRKWTETLGFSKESVKVCAKHLKHGNMNSLDITLEDLYEKGKLDVNEIESYLLSREFMANLTFKIGRKLGVKVSNPASYIEEYVEKWCTYGYEDGALLEIALFCLKTEKNSFNEMDALIEKLLTDGIVSTESVKEYLKAKNEDLKLFAKIQDICGAKKTPTGLSLLSTWRDWNFSDAMILEASKRSVASSNPIPYMNQILSNWKQQNVFTVKDIPTPPVSTTNSNKNSTVNAHIEDVNAKTDRDRYYALLREKAQVKADKTLAKANKDIRFKEVTSKLSKMEFELAKAEMYDKASLPALEENKKELLSRRKEILEELGIQEEELLPQYVCKKCLDKGYLPNGKACDCYKI